MKKCYMYQVITIDGFAGCLKSRCAELLAERIGFKYFSAGLVYRYLAFQRINNRENINIILEKASEYLFNQNHKDISCIRNKLESVNLYSSQIDENISIFAQNPQIISWINKFLLTLSYRNNLVIDGRNLGCNIFQNAILKVFVKTDVEDRVKYLKDYNLHHNKDLTNEEYNKIKQNLIIRDFNDVNREYQPLQCPNDAIVVDILRMTLYKAVDFLANEYHKKWITNS